MAWGDYDGDKKPDLLLTGIAGEGTPDKKPWSRLYHNTGNGFEDVTEQLIPALPHVNYSGLAWFDFNQDNRPDVFISGESADGTISRLFMQMASGGFTDVTDQLLPPDIANNAFKSVFVADYDNDGRVDVLLTGSGTTRILHNQITKSLLGGSQQALQLLMPLYDCQSGAFVFQTQGGDGSLIEYMAAGITDWTTNPDQFVDRETRTAADAQSITLIARQNGKQVRYFWDIRAVCPVGDPSQLRLLMPLYDCQSGAFVFQTQGGDGSLIEYMAAGITAWTTKPNQFVDQELRQAADAQPIFLWARQKGKQVRYGWNLRAMCPVSPELSSASARLGASGVEKEALWRATVSPNPVGAEFAVKLEGAQQKSVRLLLTDLSGQVVVDKQVVVEQVTHQERLGLGVAPVGLYLLRVSTAGQTKTLKVLKEQ